MPNQDHANLNILDPANWDSERLRGLVNILDDSSIRSLIFDHFNEVFHKLSSNTPKDQKIQTLLEYCIGIPARVELLLRKVKAKDIQGFETFLKSAE